MKNSWKRLLYALIIAMPMTYCKTPLCQQKTVRQRSMILENPIKDIGMLYANLFSLSSVKIIICAAPLWAATRGFDEQIHHCFYDEAHHKNINQLPRHCSWLASHGVAIPIILSGGLSLISKNEATRLTGFISLLGMPFVIFSKDLLKNWQADHCLRPRNEHFDRVKRVHGGFPSGHMAEIMYMTVLFGMRFGPVAWVPLGAFSAFMFASFVNCNRHYASQMVAGGALGAMFAVSANKIIESKLARNVKVSVEVTPRGKPMLVAGVSF